MDLSSGNLSEKCKVSKAEKFVPENNPDLCETLTLKAESQAQGTVKCILIYVHGNRASI